MRHGRTALSYASDMPLFNDAGIPVPLIVVNGITLRNPDAIAFFV